MKVVVEIRGGAQGHVGIRRDSSGFVAFKTMMRMVLRGYLADMDIESESKKRPVRVIGSGKIRRGGRGVKRKSAYKRRSYNGGLAFEYLVSSAIARILRTQIIPGARFWMLEKEYNKIRRRKVARLMRGHAWTIASEIISRVPGLVGPVRLLAVARGRNGDVCDMEIGRKGKPPLGISCKWRNRELKYPRVSIKTDLLGGWIGAEPANGRFFASMSKIFGTLKRAIERNPNGRWADFAGRNKLVREVVALCARAVQRRIVAGEMPAGKLLSFIFSERDYCVAYGGHKNPKLTYFNPRGTLNPRAIEKTRLPQRIVSAAACAKKPGTMVVVMERGRRGAVTSLKFRVHSAKGTMEMSLKCGVTLGKDSQDLLETIPLDEKKAPPTFPDPVKRVGI